MTLPWSVEELVPHSRTMVLIDDAIDVGEDWVCAGVRIAEDNVFYDPQLGGVPAWIGIEYMAQTIALFSGVRAREAKQEPKIGLLLGTRRYQSESNFFPLGTYLRVRASRAWDDGQMAVFDCTLEGEQLLASARLNVYQPEDPESLINGAKW